MQRFPTRKKLKPVHVDPQIYKRIIPRHRRFINQNWLESLVWWTPHSNREYGKPYHFKITVYKKTDGKVVKITIWVHERTKDFWVGIVHTEDRGHRK
jgi:hypothetical protein